MPIPTSIFLIESMTSFCLTAINSPSPTETMQIPIDSGPSNPKFWEKI